MRKKKRLLAVGAVLAVLTLLVVLFFPCKMCLHESAFECKLYQSTKKTVKDAAMTFERGAARKAEISPGLFELQDYIDGWGNKIRCTASNGQGNPARCYSGGLNPEDPKERIYDQKDNSEQYCKQHA